ncbi:porin family protein [Catalinimonas sp. 4WD22]|uniref:porin family protein n=1 Tax=Catalinimonas locisalis TaxID=3133978 RepID=UPI003100BDAE
MKKLTFFICAGICLLSLSAAAQITYGLKAGAMLSNTITLDEGEIDFTNTDPKLSYLAGGFVLLSFSEKLSLQPELLYVNKGGGKLEDEGAFSDNSYLHYLSLPIMLQYEVVSKLKLGAGPEFSYLLDVGESERSGIKDLDIAVNAGFSYALFQRWLVDLRYSLGVYDISEEFRWADPNDPLAFDAKTINRSLQLSVGWKLGR